MSAEGGGDHRCTMAVAIAAPSNVPPTRATPLVNVSEKSGFNTRAAVIGIQYPRGSDAMRYVASARPTATASRTAWRNAADLGERLAPIVVNVSRPVGMATGRTPTGIVLAA